MPTLVKTPLPGLALAIVFAVTAGRSVVAEAASSEQLDFFERKIRPVLAEKCFSCHSADAKKLKGSLQVDHIEHLLTGGETGSAIVPGDAEKSLLIESIRYGNEDLQMPPKERLDEAIVADFARWIDEGAVWPEEPLPTRDGKNDEEKFDLQKRYDEHWSWRPVTRPELPPVEGERWVRSEIDRFVLEKIEGAGLEPAEEADPLVWLRRVYFDLIGLPPTIEQQDAFLAALSREAEEEVVDELLASPHFGEKWARHWMDLVRYAETYGHEFDFPIDFAHEYRDYLIRAFNADLPYDRLVTEHIAGDLLAEPRRHPDKAFNESVLGTAFWYLHEATHAPTDVLANESDIMDNQIDVFGKSFLGLTISCARCHDHKFDAISTADYYALTAYLHGSARQEIPLDVDRAREKAVAELTEKKATIDAKLTREAGETPMAPVREGDRMIESFDGGIIPDGWSRSGFAFDGSGSGVGIRFDAEDPMSYPGTVDSGLFGREQVGILRSPTFTIEEDHIHLLLKGGGVELRLIIDNYQ
ncbi:MAG: DUF1549 domain-containing protein, partial [Verrucomicrobiota bacterium]